MIVFSDEDETFLERSLSGAFRIADDGSGFQLTSSSTTMPLSASINNLMDHHNLASSSDRSVLSSRRGWFEEESNDKHHFDITMLPEKQVYLPGDCIEVTLNVNVKKLQFLKATFEGISTSHKPHGTTVVEKVISNDFHLYPTTKSRNSLPPTRSTQFSLMDPLKLPAQPLSSESATSTSSSTSSSSNTSTPQTSPTSTNEKNPLSLTNDMLPQSNTSPDIPSSLRKSVSTNVIVSSWTDDFYNEQTESCCTLEPIVEGTPPSAHIAPHLSAACSEHQLLSKRRHLFIFKVVIPATLPPSFSFTKDAKNGVFYRVHFSGLGELTNKFHSEGPLIKGIETSIPISVWNPTCSFLPRTLLHDDDIFGPSETFTNSDNSITIKSRILIKNFAIIGSGFIQYDTSLQTIMSSRNQS
eukprot:gene13388-15752_t